MTASWEAKRRSTSALYLAGVLVVVGAALGTVLLWYPEARAALPLQTESPFEVEPHSLVEAESDGTRLPVAAGERGQGAQLEPLDDSKPEHAGARAIEEGSPSPVPVDSLAELQEFRSFASEALKEVRSEKAASFRAEIEQRRGNLEDRVALRSESLGLTPDQAGKLRSSLLRQLDRDAEYVRLWEAGSEDVFLAELKTVDRQRFYGELSAFLTGEQLRLARSWP